MPVTRALLVPPERVVRVVRADQAERRVVPVVAPQARRVLPERLERLARLVPVSTLALTRAELGSGRAPR